MVPLILPLFLFVSIPTPLFASSMTALEHNGLVNMETDTDLRGLAVGDLNADGHDDLVVSDVDLKLYWYRGLGNGEFDPNFAYLLDDSSSWDYPYGRVVVADMNGDGIKDVVYKRGHGVAVLVNGGTGITWTMYLPATPCQFTCDDVVMDDFAVVDFNRDGAPDIVWAGRQWPVARHENYYVGVALENVEKDGTQWGDGVELYRHYYMSSDRVERLGVVYADDDDYGDLLTMGPNPAWWSESSGTWTNHSLAILSESREMIGGDVTGDGIDDIVYDDESTHQLMLARGLGAGVFATPTEIAPAGASPTASLCLGRYGSGDATLDVVSTAVGNGLKVHQYVAGAWQTSVVVPGTAGALGQAACGDFNGDGMADLAFAGLVAVETLMNDGSGGFGGDRGYVTSRVLRARFVVSGDVTGDGIDEVFAAPENTRVVGLYMYNVATDERTVMYEEIAAKEGSGTHALLIADIDGDDLLDLVEQRTVGCCTNQIFLHKGTGNPSSPFLAASQLISNTVEVTKLLLADVDGDDKLDLVYDSDDHSSSGYAISWHKGDGGGGFGTIQDIPLARDYYSYSFLQDMVDVDGDGDVDMLCQSKRWRPNNGDGTFDELLLRVVQGSQDFADINGDGAIDGCEATSAGINCTMSIGDLSSTIHYVVALAPAQAAPCTDQTAHIVDLNMDHKLDLVYVCDAKLDDDTWVSSFYWFERLTATTWADAVEIVGPSERRFTSTYANLGGASGLDVAYSTVQGFLGWADSGVASAVTPAPTVMPTANPTPNPTPVPTANPTTNPTPNPTPNPTSNPTVNPTTNPTPNPTPVPTSHPTANPTVNPTANPTANPTSNPTPGPTVLPTPVPTTAHPTAHPTLLPTASPSPPPSPSPPSVTPAPSPGPTVSEEPEDAAPQPPSDTTSAPGAGPMTTTTAVANAATPTPSTSTGDEANVTAADSTIEGDNDGDEDDSSSSVVGVVVGVLVALLLIGVVAFVGLRRRRSRSAGSSGRYNGMAAGSSKTTGTGFSARHASLGGSGSNHRSRTGSRAPQRSRRYTELGAVPPTLPPPRAVVPPPLPPRAVVSPPTPMRPAPPPRPAATYS
jgi:hypothetical protein